MREIYFTPAHDAVLVLECDDEPAAMDALNSLPLVSQQQIRFEVVALLPYTGFDRLLVSDAGSG